MKKEERILLLKEKLAVMRHYEEALWARGVLRVAGVDEVGRGPLAGPVVAAAVVLPPEFDLLGVDDSKKLTEKRREALFHEILSRALDVSVGLVDNETIDEINILEATKRAMKEAVAGLSAPPEHILIDALVLRDLPIPQSGIVG
ncbi:MAG: ribonuclease HII, partial [Bacillota bacterium]|nr:ribonuclease HII [Bacillota bacterium]